LNRKLGIQSSHEQVTKASKRDGHLLLGSFRIAGILSNVVKNIQRETKLSLCIVELPGFWDSLRGQSLPS
jgi:hypothetical protein